MAEGQNEQQSVGKWLTIRIEGTDEIPLCYANHIFVTHTPDEFFVTFSQVHPPYLLKPTEEELKKLTHISARAVARIALTPNKMKELVDALTENYNKYLGSRQAREE